MNKKTVILILLGMLAVASLIYGTTTSTRSRPGAIAEGPGVGKESAAIHKAEIVDVAKRRAKRTTFSSWKRKPFVPKGKPGELASKLALNGIIVSGGEFKAIIGDSILGKGDEVEGNMVIEVRKDTVILNDGTGNFELKLEQ